MVLACCVNQSIRWLRPRRKRRWTPSARRFLRLRTPRRACRVPAGAAAAATAAAAAAVSPLSLSLSASHAHSLTAALLLRALAAVSLQFFFFLLRMRAMRCGWPACARVCVRAFCACACACVRACVHGARARPATSSRCCPRRSCSSCARMPWRSKYAVYVQLLAVSAPLVTRTEL